MSKKCLIILGCTLAVMLIINIFVPFLTPKIGFTTKRDDITYFPVDYEENIFEDIVYMSKNREVKFEYFGTTVYINEENYNSQSAVGKMFYDYFQTVINGKYDEYKSFFTKKFFRRHSIPEEFTMQKIYDIEIVAINSEAIDGNAYEVYKVGYKIYENNGTFRADVASNKSVPIAFTVMKGEEIKITSIAPINQGERLT